MSEAGGILRIGLLGASAIAPVAVIAPAMAFEDIEIRAIAARDPERARAFAEEYDIPSAVQDYLTLVTHPEIDLVYNALPPTYHADWSIRALAAGKHVLCEKPFALDAREARAMVNAAEVSGRRLIEAWHYRYHPLFSMLLATVRSGRIGRLREINAWYSAPIPDRPDEIRRIKAVGGGVLGDLGCYPLHWCRTLTGAEPANIEAEAHIAGEVDDMIAARFLCGGAVCAIESRMDADVTRESGLIILGETGRIKVDNPAAPQRGHHYVIEAEGFSDAGEVRAPSSYHCQLAAIRLALLSGTPLPTEGADSVATMQAIDAIRAAAGL